jgi:hypothetical protein
MEKNLYAYRLWLHHAKIVDTASIDVILVNLILLQMYGWTWNNFTITLDQMISRLFCC